MKRDIRKAALELLQPLYEAEFVEGGWQTFLQRLVQVMESDSAALVVLDRAGKPREIMGEGPLAISISHDYADHFAAIDPWPMAFAAARLPFGKSICSHELIAPDEFEKTEYYNDFWRPYGDHFHTCGALVSVDEGTMANFAVPRSRGRGFYTASDVALMDLLAPHVSTALQLRQRLTHARQQTRIAEMLLDQIQDAMILVDESGKVLYANRRGDSELAKGTRLASVQGRLRAGRLVNSSRWQQTLSTATGAATGNIIGVCGSLLSREPDTSAAVSITCHPVPPDRAAFALKFPSARVLVLLRDAGRRTNGIASVLLALYGLTRTEALIAEGLANGDALDHIAATLGMSIGTARTHLRHVFAKTDTNRQAQLVALIHRITPTTIVRE